MSEKWDEDERRADRFWEVMEAIKKQWEEHAKAYANLPKEPWRRSGWRVRRPAPPWAWLVWNGTMETEVDVDDGILHLGEYLDVSGPGWAGLAWTFLAPYVTAVLE